MSDTSKSASSGRVYRSFYVTLIPNGDGAPRTVVFAWTSVAEMVARGVAKVAP